MKIKSLELFKVPPRWLFLKITTESGIVGWGEPILSSAISGIEQALWDIKGKHLNVPVYEQLGRAVRDKMRVYCWIGGRQAI